MSSHSSTSSNPFSEEEEEEYLLLGEDEKTYTDYFRGEYINKKQTQGLYRIEGYRFIKYWVLNRSVNDVTVEKMFKELYKEYTRIIEKNEEYRCPTVSGPINLALKDGSLYVLDGQHRLNSYIRLYKKINMSFDFPIMITECESERDMIKRFQLINKHTVVSSDDLGQSIYEELCDQLNNEYKEKTDGHTIFKKNRPYIQKEIFVKKLREKGFHRKYSSSELFRKLRDLNERFCELDERGARKAKLPRLYFNKYKDIGFLLGIDKEYSYLDTL